MVIGFSQLGRKMQKNFIENETKHHARIRPIEPRDRSRIEEIVISSGRFNQEEIATALELVDEALEKGEESGYIIVVLEVGKEQLTVAGICLLRSDATHSGSVRFVLDCRPIRQSRGRDSDGV